MNIIKHCDIKINVSDPDKVTEFELSRIKPGFANEIYGLFLKGQINSAVNGIDTIEFAFGNTKLDQCMLSIDREKSKIKQLLNRGNKLSFNHALNLLGAPTETEITVSAIYKNRQKVSLGTINIKRKKIQSQYEPRYNPIILNSMGRSGTTLFMHYLSMHPEIYVHHDYPHELMVIHYWINFLESMTTPLAGDRLVNKWEMRDKRMKKISPHPYYRLGVSPESTKYLGSEYIYQIVKFIQQNIDLLCDTLIDNDKIAGRKTESAKICYFSEKSLPFPVLIKELYSGAKEIYLMRDVRDNICSAFAFNKKRGTKAFGTEATSSDQQFARYRSREFQNLFNNYVTNKDTACLVRYEELITDPTRTMKNVFKYLGVNTSDELIRGVVTKAAEPDKKLSFHQTATSPTHSIGRWKQELSGKLQEICSREAGEALLELGYTD